MPAQPAHIASLASAAVLQNLAQNLLVWVPCYTRNLIFGRTDWHVHLIELDLDNEPEQEIPGKRDLNRCSGQPHGRSHDPSVLWAGYWGASERVDRSAWGV
ncbi:hypothetical protein P7K49_021209 [Saguinus oedipus]|uniref:Uncharacterized protein n=1 Tax=Saguinus oedipus TaxID=9490 RepID=A0ABQ9USS7_SAGOE|nr:hypothetical protein P7K49_021209 [Saguinus oedipus]